MTSLEKGKELFGHRKRLRERLVENGGSKLSDTDILELLLFYAVPRRDCRDIAEAIIEKYGTLEAVLDTDPKELTEFKYLKDGAQALFALIGEVVRRTALIEREGFMLNGNRLKSYLIELFREKEEETVYALYFAEDGCYLGKQVICRGGISSTRFSLRKITEGVIRVGGKSVVIAHNHPSGLLVPSNDDVYSTKRIAAHLSANEIDLLDHYIVGTHDAISIFKPE